MKPCKGSNKSLFPAAVLLVFLLSVVLWCICRGENRGQIAAKPLTELPLNTTLPTVFLPPPSREPAATGTPEDWNLLLVNAQTPLPEGYLPELTQFGNGHAVDARIYEDLRAMLDAACAEGLSPIVCSSWRSGTDQETLFENKVAQYMARGYSREDAEAEAATWVAIPGTSEHQTGLAVDLVALSYQLLDEHQEHTPEQQWLMTHCWEYGFILRYPAHKSAVTGIRYEPWHYRYVGREAAEAIFFSGLCLEEYLQNLFP